MQKQLYILLLIVFCGVVSETKAVRPFITDDARVVGYRLGQWESWLRFDQHSGQYWHMLAYGPNDRIELTLGGVFGYQREVNSKQHFSYALPLVQAKYLIRAYEPNKAPGIGLVAGTFLPGGRGAFVPEGYGAFAFLMLSQCFGEHENVLLHGNFGGGYLFDQATSPFALTWGIGTQIKTYKGFHLVGEIFSGDPYVPGVGLSYQAGFRHFISDDIQIDATFGSGITGAERLPVWFSAGARFVTHWFDKKK